MTQALLPSFLAVRVCVACTAKRSKDGDKGVSVCESACVCVSVRVCVHLCMCICICTSMCVCTRCACFSHVLRFFFLFFSVFDAQTSESDMNRRRVRTLQPGFLMQQKKRRLRLFKQLMLDEKVVVLGLPFAEKMQELEVQEAGDSSACCCSPHHPIHLVSVLAARRMRLAAHTLCTWLCSLLFL